MYLGLCRYFPVIGISPTEPEETTKLWQEIMATLGCTVPANDFSWGATLEDNIDFKTKSCNKVLRRAKRTEGFNVFGTMLTFDGKTNWEFDNRCDKTWAVLGQTRKSSDVSKHAYTNECRWWSDLLAHPFFGARDPGG